MGKRYRLPEHEFRKRAKLLGEPEWKVEITLMRQLDPQLQFDVKCPSHTAYRILQEEKALQQIEALYMQDHDKNVWISDELALLTTAKKIHIVVEHEQQQEFQRCRYEWGNMVREDPWHARPCDGICPVCFRLMDSTDSLPSRCVC
jgi:hypothetical protein